MNNEELRRLVVAEVVRQLAPHRKLQEAIQTKVDAIDRWKLSLWSNGTGGPPGYLEIARKEDNSRYERIFSTMEDVKEKQTSVDIFIEILKVKEESRQKLQKNVLTFLKWIAAPMGTAIIGLLGFGFHQAIPVVRTVWEDYLRLKNHPAIIREEKKVETPTNQP